MRATSLCRQILDQGIAAALLHDPIEVGRGRKARGVVTVSYGPFRTPPCGAHSFMVLMRSAAWRTMPRLLFEQRTHLVDFLGLFPLRTGICGSTVGNNE